ncbi:peptidoglycan-associated lipoprotein Pal [Roseibium aggregatum]|jgi:peptidoglycan-associated lipoprotein|uniref:Peptidoglycan-associated protein n=1 Tax=Roseibium aggregatum (strain ATCC 25650 / DSM 13394 / JCM 20685 / NBRC 16684 / NCIMB 2208 / IAM 12614 / B1) TaxID=384765 RepID=A0NND1_ROSAI|nr:peptidoglycan-associated lipoprotein Pal [Roseibium aggregatum]EAV45662.1 omp16 protein [Stappia aggregata IAM 12614] [Roseibium aggregatum IAM 12614]
MFMSLNAGRSARWIAVCFAVLFAAACAQTKPDGLSSNVKPGTGQDFVVNVGDRVFFEEDQSVLNAQGQATLANQAKWLNRYSQYTITVEGHADERGTRQYNIALGARRAQSARDYLVAQGVNASRIKTISYGKERPVAVCNDNSCWSQNRRAVTVLNNATN